MEEKTITYEREKRQSEAVQAVIKGVAALGLAGAATLSWGKKARAALPKAPADWKAWAKEYMKGAENETLPSFMPDYQGLSNEGIRLDVQQAISHGFASTMCVAHAGLSLEEAKDFVSIAADEAGDRILVSTNIAGDTLDDCFEMLEHAAQVGCSHVLLGYPPNFYPESEDEITQVTTELVQAANIGIVLDASEIYNFGRFASYYGFPLTTINEVVDLPNVIGIKTTGPLYTACYWRHRQKVLLIDPDVSSFITKAQWYRQQWIGSGPYECIQSPEHPFLVQMVNHCLDRKFYQARSIWYKVRSAYQSFSYRANYSTEGVYNWPERKYYQWCTGGNGGYTRQPVMKVAANTMNSIKEAYLDMDITPSSPDEMFYDGRVNW